MDNGKRIEKLKARNLDLSNWLSQTEQRRIQAQQELIGNSAKIELLQEQTNEKAKEAIKDKEEKK